MGPFCDLQVQLLANRRFVPFAFDLNKRGGIPDADAKKAVIAAVPKLAGSAVSTPEVLFLTAEGKLLGKVSNYATEDQVLKAMQKVLAENPEYHQATAEESKAATPLERGKIAFELTDYTTAKKELRTADTDEAKLLLAQIARFQNDWKTVKIHLAGIANKDWLDDAQMEKMRMKIAKSDFEQAMKISETIPADSNRHTEATYFRGIAQSHLGKPKDAVATWKALITGQKIHDKWIYRADWAYCTLVQKKSIIMSTTSKRVSLLGRLGYMGRRNPDLP